jgi:hypothetical protein
MRLRFDGADNCSVLRFWRRFHADIHPFSEKLRTWVNSLARQTVPPSPSHQHTVLERDERPRGSWHWFKAGRGSSTEASIAGE